MSTASEDILPEPSAPAKSRRLLGLLAGALFLALAAVAAVLLLRPASDGSDAEAGAHSLYVPLEPIVVNLRTGGGQARFLRVRVTLEVGGEAAKAAVEARLPAIVDGLLGSMRELAPEDVTGAAGLYRLKEELLIRANVAARPHRVRAVLIQEVAEQ